MANEVVIHVKAEGNPDRDVDRMGKKVETSAKRSFLKAGGHGGAAFMAGFIKTVTLGQVGSGFAMAATKLKPQMAHAGGVLGVALAAGLVVKAASMVSALLPLALGAVLVAGPVAFLMKGMLKAEEESKKIGARLESLRKRYANAKDKDTKKQLKDEMELLELEQHGYEQKAKNWYRLKNAAREFMTEVSKPFEKPLMKSMRLVGNAMDDWGPKLKKALGPLAKELPGFVEGALKGIENFAEAIGEKMPSITKGFKAWGKELPGIGQALGEMLAAWIEDGPAVAEGIQDTAGSMKDLADAVGAVGKAFRGFNKTNNRFKELMLGQQEMVQGWRVKMLEAILVVVEAWAKINPKMKSVAAAIRESLGTAQRELDETRGKAKKLNDQKVETKLKADKKDAQAKIRDIDAKLQKTHNKKVISKLKADKANAQAAIANITAQLNRLNGKTAITYIKTIRTTASGPGKGVRKYEAGGGYVTGVEGHAFAAGGGARGGQVMVGEQGPEIVDLPLGSHVNSNPDTQRMMTTGKGQGNITINVNAPNYVGAPSDLLRALVDAKRRGQLDVILR